MHFFIYNLHSIYIKSKYDKVLLKISQQVTTASPLDYFLNDALPLKMTI